MAGFMRDLCVDKGVVLEQGQLQSGELLCTQRKEREREGNGEDESAYKGGKNNGRRLSGKLSQFPAHVLPAAFASAHQREGQTAYWTYSLANAFMPHSCVGGSLASSSSSSLLVSHPCVALMYDAQFRTVVITAKKLDLMCLYTSWPELNSKPAVA